MAESRQEDLNETIKRFDKIFEILISLISLILSLGIVRVNVFFLSIYFVSLLFWMLGHAIGQFDKGSEVFLKFAAWVCASFTAVVILMGSALGIPDLNITLTISSFIISLPSTILILYWLTHIFDEEIAYIIRRRLWRTVIIPFSLLLCYIYYI